MRKEIKIDINEVGMRLDLIISLHDNSISRSIGREMLNQGKIQVNSMTEFRPNYKVKLDDVITFESNNIVKIPSEITPIKMDLNIVYEDDDLLVINKPSGLVTHPANGHYDDTLMNGVLYHYGNIKKVGDNIRSGLIHRLDRDTSGLILIGKTNKGLWHYSRMFAERKVQKYYLAAVKGNFLKKIVDGSKTLEIRTGYDRNMFDRKKFSSKNIKELRRIAETSFEVLNYDSQNNISILIAKPKTGRTHQIRVHLSDIGHPILGDNIYGGLNYSRLMLHAWKLEIPSFEGNTLRFTAPIPIEFENLIHEDTSIK